MQPGTNLDNKPAQTDTNIIAQLSQTKLSYIICIAARLRYVRGSLAISIPRGAEQTLGINGEPCVRIELTPRSKPSDVG